MPDTKLPDLNPLPLPVQPGDLIYAVRQSLGAAGSRFVEFNNVLERITDGISDQSVAFTGLTVAPAVADAGEGKLYLDISLGRFRVSVDGNGAGVFRSLTTDTGIETLTNKTLTLPVIGDFTNAQHDHSNAAGGGPISIANFTGVLSIAHGGTGLSTAPTNGQLLIGSGSAYVLATLAGGTNIAVTPGAGSINIGLTGIVLVSNGGTGINGSTAPNGSLLIGNGSAYTLATLTAGTNISITNGAGSITVAGSTAPTITSFAGVAGGVFLPVANGGTGLSGAAAANGALLIGNGSGYTLATLTAGSNVTITNGAGSITIASTGTGSGVSIGDTITGATQGSILFAGAASVLAQDNANFFWDGTNHRLGLGTASPGVQFQAELTDTATTTQTTQVLLRHNSSGTPAAGFGSALVFALKDSTTTNVVASALIAQWTVATHGSATSILRVQTVTGGASAVEVARFIDSGLQVGPPVGDGFLKFASSGTIGAQLTSFGNGALQFLNQNSTGWSALVLGPATTAGMRIKNGPGATAFHLRAGDDSGWVGLSTGNTDLVTNDVALGLAVIHETPGTPTTGFGVGITFQGSSTTTLNRIMGSYRVTWTDSTDATRTSQATIAVVQAGATEAGVAIFDKSGTANNTGLQLWDASAGAIVRVSRGASDSGGTGFRLLRVPN
jgi:hypothetical protein